MKTLSFVCRPLGLAVAALVVGAGISFADTLPSESIAVSSAPAELSPSPSPLRRRRKARGTHRLP